LPGEVARAQNTKLPKIQESKRLVLKKGIFSSSGVNFELARWIKAVAYLPHYLKGLVGLMPASLNMRVVVLPSLP
jgi:hypothetical protein